MRDKRPREDNKYNMFNLFKTKLKKTDWQEVLIHDLQNQISFCREVSMRQQMMINGLMLVGGYVWDEEKQTLKKAINK